MNNPQEELKTVIRSITEPKLGSEILLNVSKYFTSDARIIHPMLNSPSRAGKEGVLAAYKMLRVLTVNNKITFHTVAIGEVQEVKGVEYLVGLIGMDSNSQASSFKLLESARREAYRILFLLDLTERLQLRFLPLPEAYNPVSLYYINFVYTLLITEFYRSYLFDYSVLNLIFKARVRM